jgi:hypothetical protein
MSKKSRKRNKKILGALAAGLGAMALMKSRGNTAAANVDSGRGSGLRDTVDSAKNWITKKNVADTQPVKATKWISPRMRGNNPNDPTGAIGQRTRGDYARESRINAVNTAVGSPMIDNPYRAPVQPKGRLWSRTYKSGGRVKGCGKAKRGFGRALKGGK